MSPHRPVPAGATSVLRGILELTADEAWQLTREALVLHDAHGHTIVLPAGSGHGDQITVRYGARTVVLSIRTPQKDLTRRD